MVGDQGWPILVDELGLAEAIDHLNSDYKIWFHLKLDLWRLLEIFNIKGPEMHSQPEKIILTTLQNDNFLAVHKPPNTPTPTCSTPSPLPAYPRKLKKSIRTSHSISLPPLQPSSKIFSSSISALPLPPIWERDSGRSPGHGPGRSHSAGPQHAGGRRPGQIDHGPEAHGWPVPAVLHLQRHRPCHLPLLPLVRWRRRLPDLLRVRPDGLQQLRRDRHRQAHPRPAIRQAPEPPLLNRLVGSLSNGTIQFSAPFYEQEDLRVCNIK